MGLLDLLFGNSKADETVKEFMAKGAVVIDVRTPAEFKGGHVNGAKNYPLQSIQSKAAELKKMNKPLILCCASGNRSGQATRILQAQGIECVNGGGWAHVKSVLSK